MGVIRKIYNAVMHTEPVAVGVVVGVVLSAAIKFGLPLTPERANALITAIVAVLTWWVRAEVTSTRTLHDAGLVKSEVVEWADEGRAIKAKAKAVEAANTGEDDGSNV